MSKQSEAKEKQGYTKKPICCSNCDHFKGVVIETVGVYGAWRDTANKRCGLGGFTVNLTAHCNEYKEKK